MDFCESNLRVVIGVLNGVGARRQCRARQLDTVQISSYLHLEYTRSAIFDGHWKPSSYLATAQSPVTATESFFSVFAQRKVKSNAVPKY